MKEIIRAETMGFCMGVRRAIELTEKTLDNIDDRPVYTLGPLIHNRLVLEQLRDRGVVELEGADEFDGGTVIIRAHGVPPEVIHKLESKGANIVDATCNRVIASMRSARSYSDKSYFVLLVGDEHHGEMKAIAGYVDHYLIIPPDADVDALHLPEKTVIIGQTTLRQSDYDSICTKIRRKFPDVEVIRSVCPATEQRQGALLDLIDRVDAVLVIGGLRSANTKKLYETAKTRLITTWHVEDENDLPEGIEEFSRIGLTAGASTPDWVIDSIEIRIQELWNQKI